MEPIPYGKQLIDESDIEEVVQVLRSDWISQGPKIQEFEEALARYCGSRYAVAVSSGTAALHLACIAAGLKPGDEAITTPITFVATANSVLFTGARPIFADIDYNTVNLDPAQVEKNIRRQTKAILPVHFAGLPADMQKIGNLAKKNGLFVIEDACHALGAEYQGRKIGACEYSDMTVFSFHPVKHITTGEGGCITTNHKKYYKRLVELRNHGVHRSKRLQQKFGGWFSQMQELGFNYRITDISCALGLSQLRKLASFLARRNELACAYHQAFSDLTDRVTLPSLGYPDRRHAWHLYLFRLKPGKTKINRRQFYNTLKAQGIHVQVHYIPIYHHPFYQKIFANSRTQGYRKRNFPNAEQYYKEVMSLPLFPGLSQEAFDYVVKVVRSIFAPHPYSKVTPKYNVPVAHH